MIREIPETLNNKDGSVDRGHDCRANASERPRQCAETQLLVREADQYKTIIHYGAISREICPYDRFQV